MKIIFIVLIISLVIMGCQTQTDNHDSMQGMDHEMVDDHSSMPSVASDNSMLIHESNAKLTLQPELPTVGQKTSLSFDLDYNVLMMHHSRKLHVIIIGEDFNTFAHLHPADFEKMDGTTVEYTFPTTGKYLVAIDYHTEKGMFSKKYIIMVGDNLLKESNLIDDVIVSVELEEKDKFTRPILFSESLVTEYTASVNFPKIQAGKQVLLNYMFKKDSRPVKDFSPYLAAPMHFAIVRDDFGEFIHTHGGPRDYIAQMENHGDDAHDHSPPFFGPSIDLLVTFPEPGNYIIFGQLIHNGKLLVHRTSISVE